MSRINHPTSISTNDPEYYAELLNLTPINTNRRLPSDRSCLDVPGIHDMDDPLAKRLQTLLNAVANISLCQKGNVSATMVRLKYDSDKGVLATQLYIAFNNEDEAAHRCGDHLENVFRMLGQVPYESPPMDGSQRVITEELEKDLIKICGAIHSYSFGIFEYRVNKHKEMFSKIREYVEQDGSDRMVFTPEQHEILLDFLRQVTAIITVVAKAHNTRQLPPIAIQMLMAICSYWENHNILPRDEPPNKRLTLLDHVDTWLAKDFKKYRVDFQLRRWAVKIMSLVISSNRLVMLTQSRHLRDLLQGKLSVQVIPSPTTTPFHCDLSLETIQIAFGAALAGTECISWQEARESFIAKLLEKREASEVVREGPIVHAELALIKAMAEGKFEGVEPYIGVSKLSCIMCSHYIRAFNKVSEQKVAIKGSHGKAYTGWFWPSLPGLDGELRPAFLKLIREQLLSDFRHYVETRRRSMGSNRPRLTSTELLNLIIAASGPIE